MNNFTRSNRTSFWRSITNLTCCSIDLKQLQSSGMKSFMVLVLFAFTLAPMFAQNEQRTLDINGCIGDGVILFDEQDITDLYGDDCDKDLTFEIYEPPHPENTDCDWILEYEYMIYCDGVEIADFKLVFGGGDLTPPIITEEAKNETVECDGQGNAEALQAWLDSNGDGGAATDNCSDVTWSHDFAGLSDDCGATGSATVTFTATDACGNTASTTGTFTIEDTVAPEVTPAEDETVECDGQGNQAALNAWLANNGGATASDVCSGVEWSNDFSGLSDDCGATGSATVTFTATDECGNSASTSATFTIEDTTPPTIDEGAKDETHECDGQGNQAALDAWLASNGDAQASDLCGDVEWSNDFAGLSDDCGATGSATVTFTATDDCGNSASTSATFTIEDTTPPSIDAEANDEVVECGPIVAKLFQNWLDTNGGAQASDACGSVQWGKPSLQFEAGCGETGVYYGTFNAYDECGLLSTTSATFTIEDTTPPSIDTEAQDETVECDGQGNQAALDAWLANNGGAEASDICGDVEWSNDFNGLSDDCGATGSATVTFTATDECGNSSSTSATFTIEDTTPPTIDEHAKSEDVECDGEGNLEELEAWLSANGGALASDTCGGVEWSNDFDKLSDLCGETGAATVTFTATDDCGNSASTTATFTIEDTVSPEVTPAEDETVECDGQGNQEALDAWLANNGGATASDVCSGVVWSNDFAGLSDDCGATGSATVTFTATDDCGNSASTSATFTIEDTTPPSIDEEAKDEVVECGPIVAKLFQNWLDTNGGAQASDACGSVQWGKPTLQFEAGCGETGVYYGTFNVYDACGLLSTTSATFTIEDTTPPSIDTEAQDETVECDGQGNQAALDAWLANNGGAEASDICGDVEWSNDFNGLSDDCGATGSATVTFTATDECGNSSSTSATFTIEDTTDPTIDTEASDETVECDGQGNQAALNAWLANNGGAAASDICSGVEWSNDFNGLSDDCGATGSATVTFTATDDCGNSASTSATFTIEDTTPPSIDEHAKSEDVECDGEGNVEELEEWLNTQGGALASDICSGVEWSNDFDKLSDLCGETGAATVTFTATDECGNSASTTATFTIVDTTPPAVDPAQDMTVECDPGAENCTYNLQLFDSFGDGWNGGLMNVYVNGELVLADVTLNGGSESDLIPLAVSNGDIISTQFTNGGSYPGEISYSVYDTESNEAASVSGATNLQGVEVSCPAGSDAAFEAWLANNGGASADDLCGELTWSNNNPGLSDDCGNTGSATVTFTATDDCGNSASTTATFTIIDTTNPVFTYVPEDLLLECDQEAPDENATAEDSCGSASVSYLDYYDNTPWQAVSNGGNGSVDLSNAPDGFTVVGSNSNSPNDYTTAAATFTKSVTITYDWEYTGEEDSFWDAFVSIVNGNVTYIFGGGFDGTNGSGSESIDLLPGDFFALGIENYFGDCCGAGTVVISNIQVVQNELECPIVDCFIRQFTAVDECGNESYAQQLIAFQDTTPPVIDPKPSDETVECDGQGNEAEFAAWLANNGGAGATDNCSEFTWSNSYGEFSDDCGLTGSVTVTFTATDACGNSSSETAVFTIEDTTPPTIDEEAKPETVECDGEGNLQELQEWLDAHGDAVASDACSEPVTWSYGDVVFTDDCGLTGTATVTFTATDDCGNSSTTTSTFTIEDTTPPTIDEEAQPETVECDGEGNLAELQAWLDNHGGAAASDACSEPLSWSYGDVEFTDDCGLTGTATVTFTVTDDCGNTSSTTSTFTIEDTTPPVQVLPDPPSINDINACYDNMPIPPTEAEIAALFEDTCSLVLVSLFTSAVGDDCGWSVIHSYSIMDECGNEVENLKIYYSGADENAPVLSGVPANETVECDQAPDPEDPGNVTALDECAGEVQVYYDFSINQGNCPGNYTIDRHWWATDSCNNTVHAYQTITVEDTTPPVLVGELPEGENFIDACKPDTEEELDAIGVPTADDIKALYEDNCGDVIVNRVINCNGDDCKWIMDVRYDIMDECGNDIESVKLWYHGEDKTAPVPTGECEPEDIELSTSQGADCPEVAECSLIEGQSITALETWTVAGLEAGPLVACFTDNCSAQEELVYTVVSKTSVFNGCARIITVEFSVEDVCGNVSQDTVTCTFFINDDEDPTFDDPIPPYEAIVECGDELPEYDVKASDNCDSDVEVTYGEMPCYGDDHLHGVEPNGQLCYVECIARTWTATDDCGNTATTTQYAYVVDTTAPEWTYVPADLSLECGDAIPDDPAVATDVCSEVTVSHVDYYTNTPWTVESNGGDGSVDFSNLPDGFSVTSSDTGSLNSYYTVGVTMVKSVTLSFDWVFATNDVNGGPFDPFVYYINDEPYVAIFGEGPFNSNYNGAGSFSIDLAAGTNFKLGLIATDDQLGEATVDISNMNFEIDNECPIVECFIRRYTATDACGNASGTVDQIISFSDTTAPEIECPADIVAYADGQDAGDKAGFTTLGTYNGKTYYLSDAEMNASDALTDALANGGYAAAINDAAENTWVRNAVSSISSINYWIGLTDMDVEGTFAWQSGEPLTYTNWAGGEPNDLFGEDCVEVYTSGLWNDLECFGQVFYQRRYVLEVDASCGTAKVDFDTPSASDLCDQQVSVEQIAGLPSGSDFPVGKTTITFKATDACGNTSTCSFDVDVICDSPAPPVAEEAAGETFGGVELDFTAYPVPFNRVVNIKYNFEFDSDVTIQVFDTKGLLILTETHNNYRKGNDSSTKLDLSRGGDQVFYVTVTTNRGSVTKKIVSSTMKRR